MTHIGRTNIDQVIAFARAQRGKPYKWGGSGPNSWDCSGLCCGAYDIVPRSDTAEMIHWGTGIRYGDLRPGDLVFPNPHHVQLFVGKTAGGAHTIIEAPRTGEDVRERQMWGFWAARRIVNAHPNPPIKHNPQAHSNYYTVKRGDTLTGIAEHLYGNARRYTVIAAANRIRSPYIIRVGQKLRIP